MINVVLKDGKTYGLNAKAAKSFTASNGFFAPKAEYVCGHCDRFIPKRKLNYALQGNLSTGLACDQCPACNKMVVFQAIPGNPSSFLFFS